jgi:acyl-CoA synthetase (AMP-forming)/AMP-acid ligase II
MNVGLLTQEIARRYPDRAAFIVDGKVTTYGDLEQLSARAGANLARAGVKQNDRVALLDDCSPLAVATVFGAARIGAAAAPAGTALTTGELKQVFEIAGCGRVGVAGKRYAGALQLVLERPPLRENDLTDGMDDQESVDGDTALVLFTSGTTSLPKAIPIPHDILWNRLSAFAVPGDTPAISITCVPFWHVGGVLGVLVGLGAGNTLVVQHRFDAGEWLELVERHHVQRTFLVPTMIHRIIDHPDLSKRDLSSLAAITYGAAPASPDLIARATKALPNVMFMQVFGQTETLGAITVAAPDDFESVGLPMPGVEVRILDPATGQEGTEGELWVRAPQNPEWHRTGDLVRRGQDGRLYAQGRIAETINRGGEKIAPEEVEDVLREHPAVVDACVFALPDAELGSLPAAAVVARASVEAEALRAWCRERLARYKVPSRIAFVDKIPTDELGKVRRRRMADLIENVAKTKELS